MNYPMTEVIATRRLPWRCSNRTRVTIEVRFGRPAPHPSGDWYCPFEIERIIEGATGGAPGAVLVRRHAFGVDSVQALYLAFFGVGAELGTLDGTPDPAEEFGQNFGFPTSPHL